MTWAHVTYAIWAFVALAAALLWAASARGWNLAGSRVGRPSALVRALLSHGAARVVVLLGWMWLGIHFFAR
jgi:hypothetical protein